MRFSIEYLTETTDEYSVCMRREVESDDVVSARRVARLGEPLSSRRFATGFQIRDALNQVVVIENFDNTFCNALH